MEQNIAVWLLVATNVLISYKGLTNEAFFEKYMFRIDSILLYKDYKRLITSGFLHGDWQHLIVNMITLVLFGRLMESVTGSANFLLIYFSSLIAGDILTLFIHRNHGDYSAIGASGAVCGVMFSYIAMFPEAGVQSLIIPIPITSWVYGVLYVAYSIFSIKAERDNVGHDAHLGGALVGMLVTIALFPYILKENIVVISLIVIPTVVFIYLIVTRPHLLIIDWKFLGSKSKQHNYTIEHRYNEVKVNRQEEIDRILDKIGNRGIDSLTTKELEFLNENSKK